MEQNVSTSESAFDGVLIQQIEGPMTGMTRKGPDETTGLYRLFFFHPDSEKPVPLDLPVDEKMLKTVSARMSAENFTRVVPILAREQMEKRDAEIAQLCKSVSPQRRNIYRRIFEGRLQMAFLLNSNGGYGHFFQHLKHISQLVKKNHGEVYTFGGRSIASAAALAFMLGDDVKKRHLLNSSELMFHLGSVVSSPPKTVSEFADGEDIRLQDLQQLHDQERGEQWQELSSLLFSQVHERFKILLKVFLDEAIRYENIQYDRPIEFSGTQAAGLGLATANPDVPHLEKSFQTAIGLDVGEYSQTSLRQFFDRARKPECEAMRELAEESRPL